MIRPQSITALKDYSLISILDRYGIKTKASGMVVHASCPFHDEKSASFAVYKTNNNYKCFGCGVAGGPIDFIIAQEGVEFVEACQILSEMSNIELEYDQNYDPKVAKVKKERLQTVDELLTKVHQKYMDALTASTEAKENLASRGFSEENTKELKYGFAPKGCRFAQEVFKRQNKLGTDTGLIREGERGEQYDYFRNRIIVPIYNFTGKIVSFAGRIIDGHEAKWINGTNSEWYNKSEILYGFQRSRKDAMATKEIHLVEGYFDCDYAFIKGIKNIAAFCNNRVTKQHAELIKNKGINLVKFIPDQELNGSGIKGAVASIKELTVLEIDTMVIVLPFDGNTKTDLHSYLMEVNSNA